MYEAAIGSITVIVLEKSYEAEICGLYICLWAIYIVDESTQRRSNNLNSKATMRIQEVVVVVVVVLLYTGQLSTQNMNSRKVTRKREAWSLDKHSAAAGFRIISEIKETNESALYQHI